MGNNRIAKYIKEQNSEPRAKCVIVSDVDKEAICASFFGHNLIWLWDDNRKGLVCPGSDEVIVVHPLAAETLIAEEIDQLCQMEGISKKEVIYTLPDGSGMHYMIFHPKCLGTVTPEIVGQKIKLRNLYHKFVVSDGKLSEDLITEAQNIGVLKPLLTLVNL